MNDMATAAQILEATSIVSRAVKAYFHRGVGASQRKRDKDAEALVRTALGDEGQIVTRRLFTDKQGLIAKRSQLAEEMYRFHMNHTLPHGDDGARLLPSKVYMTYVTELTSKETQLKNLDQQIIASYDQLVQDDISRRNAALIAQGKPPTAKVDDYPSVDQMQRYLYVSWHLEPISTANDFRFEVDETVRKRLEDRLDADKMLIEHREALMRELFKPMKAFVEKLAVPIGESGSIFRDSLVGNLNELVDRLPKLNMHDDPVVESLINDINALITPYKFNPSALREVPESRTAARDKMAELVKRLEGYGYAP